MSARQDYRLKIIDGSNTFYFTRIGYVTRYFDQVECELALYNLLEQHAAETRFKLQDAQNGHIAAAILREVLKGMSAQNRQIVEVLL